jgi:GTPase SAR1 family protein
MVEPIFDYQFRLILIGDSTVGKSSLLKYFTDGKFAEVCDRKSGTVILQLLKTNWASLNVFSFQTRQLGLTSLLAWLK